MEHQNNRSNKRFHLKSFIEEMKEKYKDIPFPPIDGNFSLECARLKGKRQGLNIIITELEKYLDV